MRKTKGSQKIRSRRASNKTARTKKRKKKIAAAIMLRAKKMKEEKKNKMDKVLETFEAKMAKLTATPEETVTEEESAPFKEPVESTPKQSMISSDISDELFYKKSNQKFF